MSSESNLFQRVAQEVALNHAKKFRSGFSVLDYAALGTAMDELDFELKLPLKLERSVYKIQGERYCSIQGKIADQIKLLDEEGAISTLYSTAMNLQLTELNSLELYGPDVVIQMWYEGGGFL